MKFAVIFDNNSYKIVSLQKVEKKHAEISYINDTAIKKIKLDNLILEFDAPSSAIVEVVNKVAQEVDLDLLWELSQDSQVWSLDDLTDLNFGDNSIEHRIGLFFAMCEPSVYFSCVNKEIKRHKAEEVAECKSQIAKQKAYQEKFDAIYTSLMNLAKPSWDIEPLNLINKPDKNSLEYKATLKASKELKLSLIELFFKIGYISSIEDMMESSFIKQYFPDGTELADFAINDHSEDIPFNESRCVFSIDELMTTEIDDAFSLSKEDYGWLVGIHISAPSLNNQLLNIASERLSTVYYPGKKITMLPENVISHYSLDQGKTLPVVSIYFKLGSDLEIMEHYSSLERVIVKDNLRTENLEKYFNTDSLSVEHGYPYEKELKLLHKFAKSLEAKRGRESVNQLMVDYSFAFDETGKISVKSRIRGNPIDKLVSELMILANGTWGRMLTNSFIPAVYRVKQHMQPVVMTLTPNSHIGLNVDYYTWASSPLRRSVDLINQSQIISLLTKSKPLSATDYAVANIVDSFDDVYGAYLKFQDNMERYWSLRYLEQENITKIKATFTYRNNVQLDGVPIVLDMSTQMKALPQGSEIMLAIDNLNFINQTFDYKLIV